METAPRDREKDQIKWVIRNTSDKHLIAQKYWELAKHEDAKEEDSYLAIFGMQQALGKAQETMEAIDVNTADLQALVGRNLERMSKAVQQKTWNVENADPLLWNGYETLNSWSPHPDAIRDQLRIAEMPHLPDGEADNVERASHILQAQKYWKILLTFVLDDKIDVAIGSMRYSLAKAELTPLDVGITDQDLENVLRKQHLATAKIAWERAIDYPRWNVGEKKMHQLIDEYLANMQKALESANATLEDIGVNAQMINELQSDVKELIAKRASEPDVYYDFSFMG